MPQTKINNYLPDLEGTNTTSPQDLALLLVKLQEGNCYPLNPAIACWGSCNRPKPAPFYPRGWNRMPKLPIKPATLVPSWGMRA
ncbi:class A beta-lactamase-related serine hydrolase [Synechocystis sp. B12]|nr:class A beta-lactamase-related serine hydrolase [Synechocystis sp. B12]